MAATYDAIIGTDGDYEDIDAAVAALTAPYSLLVKSGTYADSVTISGNKVFCKVELGSTFSSTFTCSGNNVGVLFGNGTTVDGEITIDGDECWMKARNGLSADDGMDVNGDTFFFDGGGWDTLVDGNTARDGINVNSADSIFQNFRAKTTGGSGNSFDGIAIIAGASTRCTFRLVKIDDGDRDGFGNALGSDMLFEGCYITDADEDALLFNGERGRLIGNHVASAGGVGMNALGGGDDSVVIGNIIEACTGDEFNTSGGGEDVVVVGNRVFGTITDTSGTSTIALNDLGTASCAVTGTFQSAGANESDIVSGGKTLIFTLTNSVWRNISTSDFATAFQGFLTGDHSEANDWDNEKTTILASGAFVRTSDTVLTVTLQAAASFSITSTNEIVSCAALDTSVLASEATITPDDVSYTITEGA